MEENTTNDISTSPRSLLDYVFKDVSKLISDYTSTNSYDFNEFKKLWNDRKFYLVHCLFYDGPKKNHAVNMILQFVTEKVCTAANDDVNLLEKVSGVYMWYCLFFTQLTPGFVKIRLTLDDHHGLESFHAVLREKGHHDADYIICKLKTFSAFDYVITRQQLCMGQQGDNTNKQLQSLSEQSKTTLEKDVLPNLSSIQESFLKYTSYKFGLANHLPPHLLSSSSPFDSLLSPERLKELNEAPPTIANEGEEGEDDGETQTRKVLRKAGRIKPKRVLKRREKTQSK